MKIYLNISEEYHAYTSLYKILNKLNIRDVIINTKLKEEHLADLRGKLNLEIIKKGQLYNVLRTDIDMCIICSDGEDSHSIYLTKYCVTHRIPILLLTNLIESDCLLEVK